MSDMAPFDFLRYGYGLGLGSTLRLVFWTLVLPWHSFVARAFKEKVLHKSVQYLIAALLIFFLFFRQGIVWFFLGAYREIEMITQRQAFSYTNLPPAILVFDNISGELSLAAFPIFTAWYLACYDLGRSWLQIKIVGNWGLGFFDAGLACDRYALQEIWRKAQGSVKKMLWLLLRWGMIVPLLLFVEFLYVRAFVSKWSSTWYVLLLLPDQLVQRIQPHCPATYLDVFLGIAQVQVAFTASLALGVYLAPRQWLRHLWRRRWKAARRLTPLALVQGLAALYLLLPWPLTLTYRFISRVTCDSRFLAPPEPWQSVFAVLNGAVFGVAISVLGLLVLQCYDEGRCRLGIEEVFSRLRPGAGRERARQSRWGWWLYEGRRWVVRPLLLGAGLWSGWQIGQALVNALSAWR